MTDIHGTLGILLFAAMMLAGWALLWWLALRDLRRDRRHPANHCDHNVIPVRSWRGRPWTCIYCDQTFRDQP